MKTAFKATQGHNYHVVHETKTGVSLGGCWTLCGDYFGNGERSDKTPTCAACLKLDNPLMLATEQRNLLIHVNTATDWHTSSSNKATIALLRLDLVVRSAAIVYELALTRRGEILAADWRQGAVPLPDGASVVHARRPLSSGAKCRTEIALEGTAAMTVRRYEQLRKVQHLTVVTCLTCLGM